MSEVCTAMSRGSLMGARGNSGVILSQILRGVAEVCSPLDQLGPGDFVEGAAPGRRRGLRGGAPPGRGHDPHRRAGDRGGDRGVRPAPISPRCCARGRGGRRGRRPHARPPSGAARGRCRRRGRKGFTLLIAAFLEVVDGGPSPNRRSDLDAALGGGAHARRRCRRLRYEVMYLLDAPDTSIAAFKETWGALGDSIVVVGGDGIWNCHVHTNEIGAAVEAGIEAGRPHQIRVTDLFEQVADEHEWVAAESGCRGRTAQAGADRVRDRGRRGRRWQRRRPAAHEPRRAGGDRGRAVDEPFDRADPRSGRVHPAGNVIVLPNNKNIIPVAQQVDALTERTRGGGGHHEHRRGARGARRATTPMPISSPMSPRSPKPPHACAPAKLRRYATPPPTSGRCTQGDWIAIDARGICAATASPVEAVTALLERLVDDESEIVTVIIGAEARPGDTAHIRQHLALPTPRSRPSSTTAVNPCTRISSGWNSRHRSPTPRTRRRPPR